MEFNTISATEKTKEINKLINYVKKNVKNNDSDTALYNACQTAGFMLYEFMCDYIKEEN